MLPVQQDLPDFLSKLKKILKIGAKNILFEQFNQL